MCCAIKNPRNATDEKIRARLSKSVSERDISVSTETEFRQCSSDVEESEISDQESRSDSISFVKDQFKERLVHSDQKCDSVLIQ